MKKRNLIISLIIFIAVVLCDFIIKSQWINEVNRHLNRGFIFGSLQDLPPSITLVTLTSFGGLLVFVYLLFIYLLSEELKVLKIGLGFLAGGILGNVIDRAIHGGTLDFIPLSFMGNIYAYYNPADVFQWLGALLIALTIFRHEKIIWYPENQRGFTLINPSEQLKVAFKFSMISFASTLILGIFSISYLTLTLNAAGLYQKSLLVAYSLSFLAITLIFVILAFIAGLILSNRSAGPLYAFEKYVENLLSGERKDLKLREGDNYQHLIKVAGLLKDHFQKND